MSSYGAIGEEGITIAERAAATGTRLVGPYEPIQQLGLLIPPFEAYRLQIITQHIVRPTLHLWGPTSLELAGVNSKTPGKLHRRVREDVMSTADWRGWLQREQLHGKGEYLHAWQSPDEEAVTRPVGPEERAVIGFIVCGRGFNDEVQPSETVVHDAVAQFDNEQFLARHQAVAERIAGLKAAFDIEG